MLLRQLAIGGMAEVYLARQSGPGGFEKECVIKRILPSLAVDSQFVQMFLDEARIAARLTHPHIVQIFDFGEVGNHDYFIAMEYVRGVDLQVVLEAERARQGRIPLAVALRVIAHVAEGLDAAHRATDGRGQALGIVHRDVTPSNVIVSFDGVAKICDFGIAKAVAKNGKTEVGVIKGKMPYMSPEQVQGQELDSRSDLFSLGTLLYELTVGKKPFDGTNPAEISLKVLHDVPTPPTIVLDRFPPALEEIITRALAKRAADRYQTARELQGAIDEFLVGSGIRCTSHDVAAYLDALLPGRRDQLAEESSAEVPIEATDPTLPMMQRTPTPHSNTFKTPLASAGSDDDNAPGPIMRGDLSTQSTPAFDDVRRNLGGGGGGTKFIVVGLVLLVAFGFWYLTKHQSGGEAATKPATVEPSAVAAKPEPKPPEAKPPEAKAVETKPGASKPLEGKPTIAPAGELPVPSLNVPPPTVPSSVAGTKAVPVEKPAPAPKATKPAAKSSSHKSSHHESKPPAGGGDRPLPKLPTPPPEDDGN